MKSRLRRLLSVALVLGGVASLGAAHEEPVWRTRPGPWGDLEVRTIYMEAPDALLAVVAKPNSVTRWVFEQTTEAAVRELLLRCGVSESLVAKWMDPARMVVASNIVSLYPSPEELVLLTGPARSKLYLELSKSPENEYHRDPIFILGGDVQDWLMDCGLNEPQKELFRALLWKRGESLVFSDIQALLTLARNSEEVRVTFRALTRVRSLVVELHLPLKGDRKEFIDYWSAGQTDAPRLTFINAITQRRASQSIDITHFMPFLWRSRCYTYPVIEQGLKGRFPDCHWTSLNFFNLVPRDYFLNTRLAAAHLVENYSVVEPPYSFGDVLCFLEDGEGLHTCVYIADDIVLTKNGDSILAPWALMQIKDVESIYRRSASTRIQGYRLKR